MFDNGMFFNDYKNELINRWGYSEDLAMDITMAADSLINEYGTEFTEAILEAVMSCKYVIAKEIGEHNRRETVLDVIKREPAFKDIQDNHALKDASTAYLSNPNITYTEGIYRVASADRIIVLPSTYNSNNPDSIEKMIISTDRLIKSHLNGFTIDDDILTTRTGLAEKKEKLSVANGTISKTLESETGLGLEEGLTNYTALRIMRKEYCADFDVQTDTIRDIAGVLVDSLALGKIIREAEMTKDSSTLRAYMDKYKADGYDTLMRDLDQLLKLERERKKALTNEQKAKMLQSEIENYFTNSIAPKVSEMSNNMRLEGVLDNVATKSA